MAQSKVPRLLSTFVLTSGTGLASYYGYVQNQKDPHNHPETDETPTPESADASVKQELEQSPYRHLRQKLSQKSVQAMHLLPKFPDLISSTLHAAQASPELVSPTTLSLLLNITSLDQCPHCSALYFQTLDSICASSEKHVAQVAEVSTRYGSWTLWHLAKHHAQVPTLGPSLAKLTRDESRHLCHFGPSHLVSCLRLLDHHQSNNDTDQNSNEIPSEYQEFAWWALHRACGRGRRSSRYRLRKNVIGDDRVPRTRRVVLSHPHLWNILHKGEFASPECELLAAKLVAELSLEPSDIWTDKRKLDMIGRWLESPASTDLRKAALMTLRNLAFQTSTEIRQALVQTGMPTRVYALMVEHPELRPLSIEFLSTMLNDDESSSDLDTLTLSCVQVKTWHEAEDHALQVETYVPRLLDFLCQEVFTKPEIAKTRGARKVDVETQANVVLCFERLARRVFAPDVMYQWLSCLVERGLAQSATLELDHTQVIQQRRQRSDREHPMESQAPAYQASLTELLDHLAPLCEDSGFLNEVFFPGGGPGLLASIGHQIIVAACAEETKYHRENESKELVSLKQQWCRCMANVLAQEISESSGSARKSSLDTLVQASALSLSWEMSNDIKLRSLATRVGANVAALDQAKETPPPVLYQDGVNPLYISSHHKKIQGEFDRDHVEVDVVLIHGLLGSAFSTWKTGQSQKTDENQTQHIWPCQWLVDDLEAENIRPRVLSISYEANVFSSSTPWPSLTLEQRAQVGLALQVLLNIPEYEKLNIST